MSTDKTPPAPSDLLCAVIEQYCKDQQLEWMSADDMLATLELTSAQRLWLLAFSDLWEACVDAETEAWRAEQAAARARGDADTSVLPAHDGDPAHDATGTEPGDEFD